MMALTAAGRHDDAVACGDDAGRLFPDDVALAGALNRAQSAAAAERAVTGNVVDFAVHKTLGAAAVRSNEYDVAEESYTKSLEAMEAVLERIPPEQVRAIICAP